MTTRAAFLLGMLLAAGVGVAVAAGVYTTKGGDPPTFAQQPAGTPGGEPIPTPSVTPGAAPGWHLPYVQAEERKPKFEGVLNGISVRLRPEELDALALCPSGMRQAGPDQARLLAETGRLPVPAGRFPPGVVPVSLPDVWLCGGEVRDVIWDFEAQDGTAGVGKTGSSVHISRVTGATTVSWEASAERWVTLTIAGKDAIGAKPVVENADVSVEGCLVAFRDSVNNSLTVVWAPGGRMQFCVEIATRIAE